MGIPGFQDRLKQILLHGVSTRYYDNGRDADPIFLIHGGHCGFFVPLGIESWGPVLDDFDQDYRVIAYDKLGMGETDLPLTDEEWTMDAVVAHAIRLIEALDLKNIVLMGHSRGGLAALQVSFRIPGRIQKLVIISSASAAPALPTGSDMDFYDHVERTAPTDPEGVVRHYHAAQAIAEGDLPASYVELAASWLRSDRQHAATTGYARNATTYWLPSLVRAKAEVHARLQTTGIAVPLLLVWGRNDRSAPLALGHALFDMIGEHTEDAAMLVINRAGHQVFRDQRERFSGVVVAFLQNQRSTAGREGM